MMDIERTQRMSKQIVTVDIFEKMLTRRGYQWSLLTTADIQSHLTPCLKARGLHLTVTALAINRQRSSGHDAPDDFEWLTLLRSQANGGAHRKEIQAITYLDSCPSTCQSVHGSRTGVLTIVSETVSLTQKLRVPLLDKLTVSIYSYCTLKKRLWGKDAPLWEKKAGDLFHKGSSRTALRCDGFLSSSCLKVGVSKKRERDEQAGLLWYSVQRKTGSERWKIDFNAFAAYRSLLEVEREIDRMIGIGLHHMQCGQCGEPVLRGLKFQIQTDWLDLSPRYLALQPEFNARYPSHVYRLVSAGPDSAPIDQCPKCGLSLDVSAKEIED
jgi:hypothetical protein